MCRASDTDASSSGGGVPTVALQQFLAALRAKDWVGAKRLAFRSARVAGTFSHATAHASRDPTYAARQSSPTSPTTRRCYAASQPLTLS